MWYIWKNINNKIYKNKNENPQEILRITEVEGALWAEMQLSVNEHHGDVQPVLDWQSMGHTIVCYVHGTWREQYVFTGQGWLCRTIDSDDVMMGAMNLRRSPSPLPSTCKALILVIECMKTFQNI